jgi:hypothetical protein
MPLRLAAVLSSFSAVRPSIHEGHQGEGSAPRDRSRRGGSWLAAARGVRQRRIHLATMDLARKSIGLASESRLRRDLGLNDPRIGA